MGFRHVTYPEVHCPDRLLAAKRRQDSLIGVYLDEDDDTIGADDRLLYDQFEFDHSRLATEMDY